MAIIHQPGLFSRDKVEAASDLDRLRVLLEALPDEDLMRTLEAERKGRRDGEANKRASRPDNPHAAPRYPSD